MLVYWVEAEVEGEWSKKTGTSKEELLHYETDMPAEDVAGFASAGLSFDGPSMLGHARESVTAIAPV